MKQDRSTHGECDQVAGEACSTTELCVRGSQGPWSVEWAASGGDVRKVRLMQHQRMVIGTDGDCDLRVQDAFVSGHHCALDATGEQLMLHDLGSRNGVFLANVRIRAAEVDAVPACFLIGKTLITVRGGSPSEGRADVDASDGLVGTSEPMLRLKREVRRLAKLRAPVLILGESGAGKDVVARALHRLSGRTGPYVPLNVATIPDSLADSELFGHRKGAFTGAVQAQIGAFERAHGGTLFLDEIGELAPSVQAKILRILEDGMVRPVGGVEERQVDVRVVSATWASLHERSATGQFRFDLLQRLSMVVIEVPPLRARRSDIPQLVECWLKRIRTEVGPKQLTELAIERLCSHDWPGNVRELGGAIYRACVMSDVDIVDVEGVARALAAQGVRYNRTGRNPEELLLQAGGNVSQAARLAGLPRTTFRTWLGRSKRQEPERPR
ncbi:MAG TPA: sigma 54-interacting transcriptional regulator [Polyangiaceae bacterium]|nr:sigma 54-interacting transcriptional regulator [Polyangiaceae bacterium]